MNGKAIHPQAGLGELLVADDSDFASTMAVLDEAMPQIAGDARQRFLALAPRFEIAVLTSQVAMSLAETLGPQPTPTDRDLAIRCAGLRAGYLWRVCE